MKLTREYLEAVDSITLQHSGCDCEVTGEWLAQDGDAIIKIDKCKCAERPIGEAKCTDYSDGYLCYFHENLCKSIAECPHKFIDKKPAPTVQEGGKSDE